jgi:hypothetical protein
MTVGATGIPIDAISGSLRIFWDRDDLVVPADLATARAIASGEPRPESVGGTAPQGVYGMRPEIQTRLQDLVIPRSHGECL